MSKILATIGEATKNDQLKYLSINENNELVISKPENFKDKINANLDLGKYSNSKIAEYILDHQNQVQDEAIEYLKSKQSISKIDESLNDIFNHSKFSDQKPNLFSFAYSDWMSHLSEHAKSAPLSKILSPGTHDSAAYKIDWSNPIDQGDQNQLLSNFSKALGFLPGANKLVSNWVLTQHDSITQQLEQGVRYFDLRLSYNDADKKFYISHTFNVGSFEDILKEFKSFSDQHPSEAIIIGIKPDWDFREITKQHLNEAGQITKEILGNKISNGNINQTSLNDIQNSGKNIILTTDTVQNKIVAEQSLINSFWHRKDNLDEFLKESKEFLSNPDAKYGTIQGEGFGLDTTLKTILTNTSLKGMADKTNPHLKDAIETYKNSSHYNDVSFVNLDHPSHEDLETIIQYNDFETSNDYIHN